MLSIGFIKKYKSSEKGIGAGGYSVLVNHQLLLSNILPLAPLIISFSIKHRRNRSLLESFIKLPIYEFYDLPACKKRTEILVIAASHIAHLCN